jgi:bacterioferritin-associated ferredoxin
MMTPSTIQGDDGMSDAKVDRCVCFGVTFAEMKAHLAGVDCGQAGPDALHLLRERFGCGRGCALCVPYIRAMLVTGRVTFAPDDPALRHKAV